MKKFWLGLCAFTALFAAVSTAAAGESAKFADEAYKLFDKEDIKPYIKIMKGPWVSSIITGEQGDYRIAAMMPPKAKYIIGLFDHQVGRTGLDERCAVVLVDGVNPLDRSEKIDIEDIETADVSGMRKYPMNGLTYNATDNSGKDCCLIVVDAKEEYEFGDVKPFEIPENRRGKVLGRVHVFIFAGPAMPPNPGQVVKYGKPLAKFFFTLQQDDRN